MERDEIEKFIRIAIKEAEKATYEGNSPFGIVLVDPEGEIIISTHNQQKTLDDPTAHGEIMMLREAAKKLGVHKFPGYKVYINAEPCPMCTSAMIRAKISEIFYGVPQESGTNPDVRAEELVTKATYHMKIEGGFLLEECRKSVQGGREKLGEDMREFKKP